VAKRIRHKKRLTAEVYIDLRVESKRAERFDFLDQNIDAGRWVTSSFAAIALPLIQLRGATKSYRVPSRQLLAGQLFLITGDVFSTKALSLTATDFSPLILEVKERPQLEARIGNCKLNTVVSGLLLCIGNQRMFVDIKNTPDLIEETIVG